MKNTVIQWHPGFVAAMNLELADNRELFIFEKEYNLNTKPLEIDLLIIKKEEFVSVSNEIGRIFRKYNIFEYKSPNDDVNIGTFYKALSYACLYKSEAGNVEEIIDTDITVSLVREQKPVKLLKQLGEKYTVTKKTNGIYRIDGMLFPMQILVTKELNEESHVWVTSLTRTLSRERAHKLLYNYSALKDNEDKRNADSVMNVTSQANIELFKKMIQEGDQMCEELKELLAPEIVEFKIRLAEQSAQLADKDAKLADNAAEIADKTSEIAKLKKLLADAGIEV